MSPTDEPVGWTAADNSRSAIHGGESGSAIDVETPGDSHLLHRVRSGEMPPEEKGISRKLPPDEVKLIERWINAGAAWPEDRVLDWFEQTTDQRAVATGGHCNRSRNQLHRNFQDWINPRTQSMHSFWLDCSKPE